MIMDDLYNEVTWCVSDCDNLECFRHITNAIEAPEKSMDYLAAGECPVKSKNIKK